MVEGYGVLFKFNVDTGEGLQLVQENHVYIKKCVRKLAKKYDIFTSTDVTRTIKLLHSGVEKHYQLRISPNTELIYSTKDPSYKGDWTTMGFMTVYFEPANVGTETKQQEDIPKEVRESPQTAEKLEEIKIRLDKLETLINSANHTPVKVAPKPAVVRSSHQAPTAAPAKPTATPIKSPVANQHPAVIANPPAKGVNNVGPTAATPKKSATSAVTAKLSANVSNGTAPKAATPKKSTSLVAVVKPTSDVSAQLTGPQKPAPLKATPTTSKAKKPPTTKFLVPYNVSQESNPKPLVNSTPHAPARPQVDGDQESSGRLKRPLNTSGDVVEANSAKKKPRQELTSDPGALAHLEEIIDAVAVGLDDPDDFVIESPFTQQTMDEQSAVEENGQEEIPVMNYQEFVEIIPKKKRSKKHRHSKENEISSILE